MTRIIQERIERGSALLDEEMPIWYKLIDIGKLDIDDPGLCVLGQAYGCYHMGAVLLFGEVSVERRQTCIDHGFLIDIEDASRYALWEEYVKARHEIEGSYNLLWKEHILAKRAQELALSI